MDMLAESLVAGLGQLDQPALYHWGWDVSPAHFLPPLRLDTCSQMSNIPQFLGFYGIMVLHLDMVYSLYQTLPHARSIPHS